MPDYLLTDPTGAQHNLSVPEGPEHDFTDFFNTPLTPDEQRDFYKRFSRKDFYDYDMQGWFKANRGQPHDEGEHFPDTFKKPNHPTFSDESQYSKGEFQGGHWEKQADGTFTFKVGPTNRQFHSREEEEDYFKQVEPGNKLEYLLTGPDGQSFNLTVPEGTDPASIPETLSTVGAFEAFAKRTRQAVVGQEERPTPEVPKDYQTWGNLAEATAHNYPHVPEDIRAIPQYIRENPEEIASMGMGGITGGARSFASPRQIRSHLDELSTALREGRITQEQFGQARERLGLPRDTPDFARPRLVTPGQRELPLGSREVNPQTLSEMRSAQPTEQQMVARAARGPQRSEPTREGILGGDPAARSLFAMTIGQHQDEQTFARSYFNGAYSPAIRFKHGTNLDNERFLDFDGDLVLKGDRLGSIHRLIYPDAGYAYNAFLQLKPTAQAGGFTKGLMANQFDLYRKMGLERVNVFASVSLGGYSWAKYGFLPVEKAWLDLKGQVGIRLTPMRRLMSPEDFDTASALLSSPDPRAIWAISDMSNPIELPSLKNPTVGKALLAGTDWSGEFRFDNPNQNVRFDRYVAKRQ